MSGRLFLLCGLAIVAYDRLDTPQAVSMMGRVVGPAKAGAMHPTAAVCEPGGVIAAALRNSGDGWRVIADADHAPVNVAAVETTGSAVTVRFTATARRIFTFVVAPDEALARAGITAGASVGMDRAHIFLSRTGILGTHAVSPLAVTTTALPWSNLWIHGALDVTC